jgi:hypothetical protein
VIPAASSSEGTKVGMVRSMLIRVSPTAASASAPTAMISASATAESGPISSMPACATCRSGSSPLARTRRHCPA